MDAGGDGLYGYLLSVYHNMEESSISPYVSVNSHESGTLPNMRTEDLVSTVSSLEKEVKALEADRAVSEAKAEIYVQREKRMEEESILEKQRLVSKWEQKVQKERKRAEMCEERYERLQEEWRTYREESNSKLARANGECARLQEEVRKLKEMQESMERKMRLSRREYEGKIVQNEERERTFRDQIRTLQDCLDIRRHPALSSTSQKLQYSFSTRDEEQSLGSFPGNRNQEDLMELARRLEDELAVPMPSRSAPEVPLTPNENNDLSAALLSPPETNETVFDVGMEEKE